MISLWQDDRHVWEKRKSKSWKVPRFGRSRKPIFLALCTVALFLWWHHSATSPTENFFHQRNPNPTKPEKRSIPGQDRIALNHRPADLDFISLPEDGKPRPKSPAGQGKDRSKVEIPSDLFSEEHQHTETDEEEHKEKRKGNKNEDDSLDDGSSDNVLEKNDEAKPAQRDGQQVISPNLDPETERGPVIAMDDSSPKDKVLETESDEHLSLEEKGDSLPEIVHTTFEESVKDMKLEGWEDDWVSHASFSPSKWGTLKEPKIDFVYLWVNGSEEAFQRTKRPFELNSVLNDEEGKWINSHGVNRYRDWDELRYSLRSLEAHAGSFRNKIQILVNSVKGTKAGKQIPTWLNHDPITKDVVQVLSQEEFFDHDKHVCLPTFNSLTIENQIFNTPSDTDQLFALSDDMLLGKPHAASDIYSPLFGPVMGFKTNSYSAVAPPTEVDAHRFGEKPFLIYTSWLLNRRFGIRKRKGQGHFGHSLSRSVTREAIGSFPGPEIQSACKRFRGEPGFQLYSWYATFHYVIERHREALLWSYIMLRSDVDGDENLSWSERQVMMQELEDGMKNEGKVSFRKRNFYHVAQLLEKAGLEAPKVNTDVQWTSLDGPSTIQNIDCIEFDVNECLAPGFSTSASDEVTKNPVFSTALVFDRVARQNPKCGDCLLKLILNQVPRGLSPLLPHADTQAEKREIVVKAAMRYRYSIINPDALFVMVTDAEQIDSTLVSRFIRSNKPLAGQLCLNDDVSTEDEQELQDVQQVMTELYQGLFPNKSPFEK